MKKRKMNWKLLLLIGAIFSMQNIKAFALEMDGCYLHNNNNLHISETEYNNLINLGFTDFQIQNMELDEFNANKDLIGEVVATTTKYYRNTYLYDINNELIEEEAEEITEEEYNETEGGILPLSFFGLTVGYSETTMKQLETNITAVEGNRYRYKVDLNWKSNPVTRSYDIIGIGIESNKVYPAANTTFKQTYCTSSSSCSYGYTAIYNTQSAGVGASFQLPTGTFTTLSSYLYFDVAKRNNSTINLLRATGDYKHARQTVTDYEATSYNINLGGIHLFDGVIGKYDSMPTADAEWTGSW